MDLSQPKSLFWWLKRSLKKENKQPQTGGVKVKNGSVVLAILIVLLKSNIMADLEVKDYTSEELCLKSSHYLRHSASNDLSVFILCL